MLADFIAEFTYPCKEEEPPMETWTVQTDGSATRKIGGVGVVFISPEKESLKYAVRLQFTATNNEAKYEALLTGLSLAKALGAKNLIVQANSPANNWTSEGRLLSQRKKDAEVLKDHPTTLIAL